MPIKFTKDVSTHLFKYISTIDIKFNPFDSRTTSARELLRRVQSSRFKTSNPQMKILIDVHDRPDTPLANFQFVDGSSHSFETVESTAEEMMFQIHLKASQIDAEFEMAGKSVDDATS